MTFRPRKSRKETFWSGVAGSEKSGALVPGSRATAKPPVAPFDVAGARTDAQHLRIGRAVLTFRQPRVRGPPHPVVVTAARACGGAMAEKSSEGQQSQQSGSQARQVAGQSSSQGLSRERSSQQQSSRGSSAL